MQIRHALDLIALKSLIELEKIYETALNPVRCRQKEGLRQAAVTDLDRKVYTFLIYKVEAEPLRRPVLEVIAEHLSVYHLLVGALLRGHNCSQCWNVIDLELLLTACGLKRKACERRLGP